MSAEKSSKFWNALFSNSPQPLLRLGQTGEIKEANPAIQELLEAPASRLVGSFITELMPTLDFPGVCERELPCKQEPRIVNTQLILPPEKSLFVGAGFSRLSDHASTDIICFVTDLSESHLKERMLAFFAYSQRTFDSIVDLKSALDHAVDFTVDHLADWARIYMVREDKFELAAARGGHQIESSQTDLREIILTGSSRLLPRGISTLIRKKEEVLGVLCLGLDVGDRVFNRLDFIIVEELACKLGIIIERAALYGTLKEMRDSADAASHAKTLFLANVSHEIRTPLAAILGYVELFSDPKQNASEQARWKKKIYSNAHHLLRIIDDILDLSKVEVGHIDVNIEKLDLAALLSDVFAAMKARSLEKSIRLGCSFLTPAPRFIESDATRLHQILCNIIGNAIKFTDNGGVMIHVSYAPSILTFAISDSGPGLTPQQADDLFQPFSQGESSHVRRHGGTGLGLALSRSLAKKLGGDVVLLKTAPTEGSTFTVTIDVGTADSSEWINSIESEQVISTRTDRPSRCLNGVRALVVDDSPDNQTLLEYFLTDAGAQVTIASNGEEAVSQALQNPFDVVLMDIQMPIMDGYTATRELRKQGFTRPIIALTAHAMREEKTRCLEAGCDFHLAKPVEREIFLSTIFRFTIASR